MIPLSPRYLRILRVIHSLDSRRGGPVSWLEASTQVLLAKGHEVDVVCLDAPTAPCVQDKAYRVIPLGPAWGTYGYTQGLGPWLKQNSGYDRIVVEGLWQYLGWAVYKACLETAIPYLVYPHGMLDPWFNKAYPLKALKKYLYWWLVEYRVLAGAAAVVFTTELEREAARKSFWPYKLKDAVVPLGVKAFSRLPKPYERKPHTPRQLLFLGRIHPKKGVELLLAAWKAAMLQAVQAAPGGSSYTLCLAGPSEPPYLEYLQAQAKSLGIGAAIRWLGMQEGEVAKLALLEASEAFILPSYQENFALSLVESLAAGRPVLTTKAVQTWPFVIHSQAGLVSEPNIGGIQQLLEGWMGWTAEDSAAFSRRAYACYQAHFQLHSAVDQFLACLSSCS